MSPWHSNKGQLGRSIIPCDIQKPNLYQLLRKVTPPMTESWLCQARSPGTLRMQHREGLRLPVRHAHSPSFHSFIPPLRTCSVTCIVDGALESHVSNSDGKIARHSSLKIQVPRPHHRLPDSESSGERSRESVRVTSTLSYERWVRNDWSLCLGEPSGLIALWIEFTQIPSSWISRWNHVISTSNFQISTFHEMPSPPTTP